MKNRIFYIVFAALFLMGLLVPNGTMPASAQPPEPESHRDALRDPGGTRICQEGEPCKFIEGEKENPELEIARGGLSVAPRATGGPDDFGYTWDDTETYEWIDAREGQDSGLSGLYNSVQLDIGFDFKFYGSTYSELYVTTNGFISFGEDYPSETSNDPIPDLSDPNNLIAPFWDYICVNYYDMNNGKVYYFNGGTSPDRFFVIEWYKVSLLGGPGAGDLLTFQVILHEDGDIIMQYQEMNGNLSSSTVGIEDSSGTDGLQYLYNSEGLTNGKAIRFYYPPPSYRLRVSPLFQGDFTCSNGMDEFLFTITNTGELGPDTYDLDVNITPESSLWMVELFDAETGNLLEDTDGDGIIDTGSVLQGGSMEVLAIVTPPSGVFVGDGVTILIAATSSGEPSKQQTITLESTVPAPFTQTYSDYSDDQVNNALNWPVVQLESTVEENSGSGPAIVETPENHFVNIWRNFYSLGDGIYGSYLSYAVVDHLGQVIKPKTQLTFFAETSYYEKTDDFISMTATTDGSVGLLWIRKIGKYESDVYFHNYNVWFAVLTSNGNLAYGPVNLTNNNQWGNLEQGSTAFGDTKIEASADNRFMLAWVQGYSSQHSDDADVYYMMRNSSGAALTGVINMTADAQDAYEYSDLTLTTLDGNSFFVYYERAIYNEEFFYYSYYPRYRIFNSNGDQIVGETTANLPYWDILDSIQMIDGNILFVNDYYDYDTMINSIGYIVLNKDTYQVVASEILSHPSARNIAWSSASVTKTQDGDAIITWMDEDNRYLYYVLLDSSGTVLSGPVIFNRFEDGASINTAGNAITTNSWQPAAGVDTLTEFRAPLYGAAPGGMANVQISYANQGLTTATNVQLTLTLPAELSYSHDTSGITPTVVGDTITWDLNELDFADNGRFSTYVEVPSGTAVGTFNDLSMAILQAEVDADPTNNTDECQVMAAELLFLPIIMR